jgi:hypothetical protein
LEQHTEHKSWVKPLLLLGFNVIIMISTLGLADFLSNAALWPQSGVIIIVLAALGGLFVLVGIGLLVQCFLNESSCHARLGLELIFVGLFSGAVFSFFGTVLYACYVDGMCL